MNRYELDSDGTLRVNVWPLKYLAEVLDVDPNVVAAFATAWEHSTGPAWVCLGGPDLYFDPNDVESWLRERADCVAYSLKHPEEVPLLKKQGRPSQEVSR